MKMCYLLYVLPFIVLLYVHSKSEMQHCFRCCIHERIELTYCITNYQSITPPSPANTLPIPHPWPHEFYRSIFGMHVACMYRFVFSFSTFLSTFVSNCRPKHFPFISFKANKYLSIAWGHRLYSIQRVARRSSSEIQAYKPIIRLTPRKIAWIDLIMYWYLRVCNQHVCIYYIYVFIVRTAEIATGLNNRALSSASS